MKNKIEQLVSAWKDTCQTDKFSENVVRNIAANCISLAETWFDRHKPKDKESFFITLFNKDGIGVEDLFGVTKENLPFTMVKILTGSSDKYSKIEVKSFINGIEGIKDAEVIGDIEIS